LKKKIILKFKFHFVALIFLIQFNSLSFVYSYFLSQHFPLEWVWVCDEDDYRCNG